MKEQECTLSLEGIEIRPNDINFINASGDPNNGEDVELRVSDGTPGGSRVKISQNLPTSKYGKLNITGIKFSMPDLILNAPLNYNVASNPNRGQFQAVVTIYSNAMNGVTSDNAGSTVANIMTLPPIKKNVMVEFERNAANFVSVQRCVPLSEIGL